MKKLLFIIFFLFSFNCFAESEYKSENIHNFTQNQTGNNCKTVKFDFEDEKYQKDRIKIIEIEELSDFSEKNRIGIDYYDLNDDGKNEIIAKVCNPVIYGYNECIISIYKNENDIYKYIGIETNFDLCISTKKTNGYYDLYSTVEITDPNIKFKNINDYLQIKEFKYKDELYQ